MLTLQDLKNESVNHDNYIKHEFESLLSYVLINKIIKCVISLLSHRASPHDMQGHNTERHHSKP